MTGVVYGHSQVLVGNCYSGKIWGGNSCNDKMRVSVVLGVMVSVTSRSLTITEFTTITVFRTIKS